MYAMNAGYTEDEFVQLVSGSDFAYVFATEDGGRDRSNRLEGRLRKVWDRAEDGWNPPLREAIDVRERLEALSHRIAEHRWSGRTAASDRSVALALAQWAHEVGAWTLDAGTRELALRANVAHSTAKLALGRVAASGLIRRDKQERQGNHSQRWVLDLAWGLNSVIGPYEPLPPLERSCGLKMEINHPVFLRSALGQTAKQVWLALAETTGEWSTAREITERTAIKGGTLSRALTKLTANGLAVVKCVSVGRGRPSKVYQLDQCAILDDVAASFGVLDWHERTAERYERERGGYREVQRQREQRKREQHAAAWKPAEDGWWIPDPFAVPGTIGL
jgi:predicted transcriptional regulator